MRIPKILLPILVLIALFGGYFLRKAFTQPTTMIMLGGSGHHTLTCTVDGLRCKGTASFFSELYENKTGIKSIVTYATEHRAVFTFDPAVISADSIRKIMEAPIPFRDGTSQQVFTCTSMQ